MSGQLLDQKRKKTKDAYSYSYFELVNDIHIHILTCMHTYVDIVFFLLVLREAYRDKINICMCMYGKNIQRDKNVENNTITELTKYLKNRIKRV